MAAKMRTGVSVLQPLKNGSKSHDTLPSINSGKGGFSDKLAILQQNFTA